MVKIRPTAKPQTVIGQLKKTEFIENIVSEKKQKKLSFKVTLTVEFSMSLVGVLTFFSLETMVTIRNFQSMITKVKCIVSGIALAGRKATIFHTIRYWEQP